MMFLPHWTLLVVMSSVCCVEVLIDSNSQVFGREDNEVDIQTKMIGERPNIVLIVADDMGWGDVGANWPKTVDTPNIDLLARDGFRLTDFHSGASVCSPSRAALLTGRLGLRTGVVRNFGDSALGGIPENETTLGEIMQEAGYRTAMLENSVYTGDTSRCFQDLALPLYRDRKIVHQPVLLSSVASAYADFAANFIESSSSDDTPYFLYAAFSHIHVPLAHAQHFDNITGRGVFADTLRELDWLVGQILSAVAKHGNNTLVWFLSDNGPWVVKCDLAGSGGPFTGDWQRDLRSGGGGSAAKQTVWEAGHRVPSVVYWPKYIQAGGVSSALISALDVMPTLASLANATLPPNRYFDGIDVLPVIMGFTHQGHRVLFHPNSGAAGPEGEIGAVRIGPYKVVYYSGGSPDCSGHAGPVQYHLTLPLVFHLDVDPAERSPLEPSSWKYRNVVRKAQRALSSLLDNIRADNTSCVDYTVSKSARPCCDTQSLICRCPWD
ncbi:arylsulfatase G isoform X2 [Anabrus simplex]|uniref:arylsulfatase G isoform X2 n=1 Tax=Anabrus simplex TaxID=316456 RepID=UPI0035A3096F